MDPNKMWDELIEALKSGSASRSVSAAEILARFIGAGHGLPTALQSSSEVEATTHPAPDPTSPPPLLSQHPSGAHTSRR
jgi:hypothetical protein